MAQKKAAILSGSKSTSKGRKLQIVKRLKLSGGGSATALYRKNGNSLRLIGAVRRKDGRDPWTEQEDSLESKSSPSWAEVQRLGKVQYDHIGIIERHPAGTILLDYDRPGTPPTREIFSILRMLGVRPRYVRHDRTRKGWHVIISLAGMHDPLVKALCAPSSLVALQSICGSDPKRELLNLMRVSQIEARGATRFSRSRWNLLYSRKLSL